METVASNCHLPTAKTPESGVQIAVDGTSCTAKHCHAPSFLQVVIVDEIGTEAEALACRTIAERGVMLVGTAHGQLLENLIKNPTLCDLVRTLTEKEL